MRQTSVKPINSLLTRLNRLPAQIQLDILDDIGNALYKRIKVAERCLTAQKKWSARVLESDTPVLLGLRE